MTNLSSFIIVQNFPFSLSLRHQSTYDQVGNVLSCGEDYRHTSQTGNSIENKTLRTLLEGNETYEAVQLLFCETTKSW